MSRTSNQGEEVSSGDETSITIISSDTRTTITRTSTTHANFQIHQVCLPPHITTYQKLKHRLHEIFFPDDPFYIFKNQTCCRKFVLGLRYVFPILEWGSNYSFYLFRSDLIAGLTIASLAIPQVRYLLSMTPDHLFFIFYFYFMFSYKAIAGYLIIF